MIHPKQGLLLERNFCSDVTCEFGQLLIPENLRVTCEVRIQLSIQIFGWNRETGLLLSVVQFPIDAQGHIF